MPLDGSSLGQQHSFLSSFVLSSASHELPAIKHISQYIFTPFVSPGKYEAFTRTRNLEKLLDAVSALPAELVHNASVRAVTTSFAPFSRLVFFRRMKIAVAYMLGLHYLGCHLSAPPIHTIRVCFSLELSCSSARSSRDLPTSLTSSHFIRPSLCVLSVT